MYDQNEGKINMAVVGEEVEVLERLSVGSLWNETNRKIVCRQ